MFKTHENLNPNELMETAGVRLQGYEPQPESATEELNDGDQDGADADMKTLRAVFEDPLTTIGRDCVTLGECQADEMQEEESYMCTMSLEVSWVQIWSVELRSWNKPLLETARCTPVIVDSHLVSVKTRKVIRRSRIDTNKKRRTISRRSLPVNTEEEDPSKLLLHPLHLLMQ